eukprot:11209712-Karenia_brevis.AAC.1
MHQSVGQASVIVRKSDQQRDLNNTRARRGTATLHDPLINPVFGGRNQPFESLTEGMASTGVGWHQDG